LARVGAGRLAPFLAQPLQPGHQPAEGLHGLQRPQPAQAGLGIWHMHVIQEADAVQRITCMAVAA